MLGRNPGYITTQGMILADLFAEAGYPVISVSSKLNKAARLADIAQTIIKNRNKIDVLILEVYSGLSMFIAHLASFLCKIFGIPHISVLHGGNLPEFTRRHPRWVKRVLNRADVLIAPSAFMAKEMSAFGFNIEVIRNVIDLSNYPFKLRENISPNLIWMRSFHPIYNPEMAVRVLASLLPVAPNARLVMAGVDKGIEAKIKETVVKLGLQDVVRFPGFLSMTDKANEFSQADIYLNTNHIDNTPVSVLEAFAMGLPVIATNVGGLSHLITNNENGLLIPDNDVKAMTIAIKNLLNKPDLTERLSRNGRLLVEKFSWNSVRRDWEELFAKIIKQN